VTTPTHPTYLDQAALPYFFCPGCGHSLITDHLNAALVKLQPDPRQVVIVSDIGCSGLADRYFATNAFHGLHGRSLTYATGIKLANPELKVIVLIGDGGCGIGGHHLINAARRNIGLTMLVYNNLNYGMTGGQHSVATPAGGLTATTPLGQLERPMDICQTAAVNGAGLVIRTTAFDTALTDLIAEAIAAETFALLDIWELCTAYYAPTNRLSRQALAESMEKMNFKTGVLHREERPEYSRLYRQVTAPEMGRPASQPQPLSQRYSSSLDKVVRLTVAGAAGKKINTAAALFCRAAVLAGLSAEQRNDYPVTVKSGHSVSEIILSPHEQAGEPEEDIYLILAEEGLKNVRGRLGLLTRGDSVYAASGLPVEAAPGQIHSLEIPKGGRAETRAVTALAGLLRERDLFPLEALIEAAGLLPAYAEENRQAIALGSQVKITRLPDGTPATAAPGR
jgi:2-oxoglutarate/2-oxoacid ferredoxin oxidoreductase subunit beta